MLLLIQATSVCLGITHLCHTCWDKQTYREGERHRSGLGTGSLLQTWKIKSCSSLRVWEMNYVGVRCETEQPKFAAIAPRACLSSWLAGETAPESGDRWRCSPGWEGSCSSQPRKTVQSLTHTRTHTHATRTHRVRFVFWTSHICFEWGASLLCGLWPDQDRDALVDNLHVWPCFLSIVTRFSFVFFRSWFTLEWQGGRQHRCQGSARAVAEPRGSYLFTVGLKN